MHPSDSDALAFQKFSGLYTGELEEAFHCLLVQAFAFSDDGSKR